MAEKYLCPKCNSELEVIRGCGSEGFFCDKCKSLVSSKSVIKVEEKK